MSIILDVGCGRVFVSWASGGWDPSRLGLAIGREASAVLELHARPCEKLLPSHRAGFRYCRRRHAAAGEARTEAYQGTRRVT
jgi:hypothetical protein